MKKLDEITIADLMPDSISGDAQVSATARAIDPQLRLVSEAAEKPLILYSIDDLSAGVLEHLAVQYDVTTWDSAWPIETKRAVLKTAIADKRKKGTRGAVQRAIEAVAPVATITEWWQADPPETPHTFRIDVLQDGSAVDAETQADVIAQVNEAKPVRSHFAFNVGQLLGGDLYFAGVLRAIAYARVRDSGIVLEQMGIRAGILAAMRGMSIRRILAETEMGEMPEPTPSAETLDLILGMRSSGSGANDWISVTYSAGDGYWAGIRNAKDLYEAESFGLQIHSNKWEGNIGGIVMDYTYGVELLDVYSDMSGESPVTKGDGWDFEAGNATGIKLVYLAITNTIGFSTPVMSFKARFTRHDSMDITVYFNSSHTAITDWLAGDNRTLYWGWDPYVFFDNGKRYSVIGLYNGNELLSKNVTLFSARNTANTSYYTYLRMKNASGSLISEATHAIIRIENVVEREAWFNATKTNKTISAVQSVYNTYGLLFNENFERVLEIVRFEDENGNTVSADLSIYSLRETTGSILQFYRPSGSATFTAAKIVYRSIPKTRRAWLNTNHTGQRLNAYTIYPLYDEAGNHPPELSATGDALLGLYDENGNAVSFSSSYDSVTNSEGYLSLYIGNQAHSNVAFIIYKES